MSNMTETEKALVEALTQWTTKQGVVLVQVNPFFFMQTLREQGLEIVKSEELVKIRYEHKFLRDLILGIFKTANAAKVKLSQLDANKDLLKDRTTEHSKTQSKATNPRTKV